MSERLQMEYDANRLGFEAITKCFQGWDEHRRAHAGAAPSADVRSALVTRLTGHVRQQLDRLPERHHLPAAAAVIEGMLFALTEFLNVELGVLKESLSELRPGSSN